MMRYLIGLSVYVLFFRLGSFGLAYADGPYHGSVVDADTKQPIAGAVVFAEWWTRSPGLVQEVQSFYDAQETVTDNQRNFVIPGIINLRKRPDC
jgi:hypothetical protein